MLEITSELAIPDSELSFVASRSSGPGGQNVNKVATRVTLLFDVEGSPTLDSAQKQRIRRRLSTRINKQGVLRVASQRHRTRRGNLRAARERLAELLREALSSAAPRRPTRPSAGAGRRRLEEKRRRGELKRRRRAPSPEREG